MKYIQSIRGMKDYLPNKTSTWQYVESVLKRILNSYGYSEIRLPIIEQTTLFKRAIGKVTDIVTKEMYNFQDKNGDWITLRPEGTAGCARAIIEHNLLYNYHQRLWYIGPMFRRERPQKGRYRQFHQLGVEVFGQQGPDIDIELIMLGSRCWRDLGISKYIFLELNSIGSLESRISYQNALIKFLKKHEKYLDDDCKLRIYNNPLRILDSKNPVIQTLLNDAPILSDYLDSDSKIHFFELCKTLKMIGIKYNINHHLVRGLDYYNRTVFEWISSLDSQKAICAGGRYDNLVAKLGGNSIPAIGFAIGIERLLELIQNINPNLKDQSVVDIYLIISEVESTFLAIKLAECIRDAFPNIRLMTNHGCSSLKKQFTLANKLGSRIAVILNKSEILHGKVLIQDLRTGKQKSIVQEDIISYLRSFIK